MRTVPPVTINKITDADLERRVQAWNKAHRGFDATNYVDAFRDADGELVETDEFFDAVELFSLYELNNRRR